MKSIDLYLVRHGLAGEHGSYENDDERPLTEEGQKKTRQVAEQLKKLDLEFDVILTSPLVRARQTAEILMNVGLSKQLEEAHYLADGDIHAWLEWLKSWQPDRGSLALVGHEPSLSQWAETLIWGQSTDSIQLKKAGVIGLSLPGTLNPIGHSTLFWLSPPRFLLS